MNTNTLVAKLKQGVLRKEVPAKDCFSFLDMTIPAGTSYLLFTQTADTLQTDAGACISDQGGEAGYGNTGDAGILHPAVTEHIIITNTG